MSNRIPSTLYPSEFRDHFSGHNYDVLVRQYQRDTAPEQAYADNGKCYEVSAHYNSQGDRVIRVKKVK
jgi:hypothetical protein